jgi:hypothetical protein
MTSTPTSIRFIFGAFLLVVPALLADAAIPRLIAGARTETSHRLVLSAIFGQNIPIESARAAAETFEDVPTDDGDDRAQGAEFLSLAANDDPGMLVLARQHAVEALAHAPTNPRAWTLLCALETDRSPQRAVACLDTGFVIARYDWFTADWRMRLVAIEWPILDERLRDSATSLILPMWNSAQWSSGQTLRDALYDLSRSDTGRQLLRAGLVSDREALRSFNRFVIEERLSGR